MASDTYYRYQDLEKNSDGLYIIPDDIVIYLIQSQVDQIRMALTEAARAKGKLRNIDTEKFISTDAVQSGVLLDSDIYVITKGVETKYLGPGKTEQYLDMFPKLNDANKLAQTDISYNKQNPNYMPPDRDFVAKLKKWLNLDLIEKEDYNNIIMAIFRSSGSVHNDWVYSLSGEDNKRGEGETLDIHDRRIDDPNVPLTVKGGVNVGDPDNASDRKKLSVFGETELQDGTSFGRLLDTYGEQHPMEFGHLIPDQGQYPKVYINRGEDRFNAEDWDDNTYGLGLGTIEAGREIVSHTTINADRGIIIEDGVGDEKDKIIQKNVRNDINYFEPTGVRDHDTNGFALSVHHDGAKIQGHTYMQDEGGSNQYFIDSGIISRPNASAQDGTNFEEIDLTALGAPFQPGCWFCEENEGTRNDWQYIHYCTNKNNDIEPVVDKWYGQLYYEGTRSIHGHEGWKYCYEDKEFYYDGHFHRILTHRDVQVGEVFKLDNNPSIYYSLDVDPLSGILQKYIYNFKGEYTDDPERAQESTDEYPIYYVPGMTFTQVSSEGVEDWGEELTYTSNIRVIPKTNMIYQIKQGYTQAADIYALVDAGTYNVNDYFYWNGAKYVKISESKSTYTPNQDFGALTIGTRANGEQDNDTIGRNSLEVGKENEATGDSAVANGQATTAAALNSHAEGLGTKIKSTGLLSHIEGLGDYSELVEYQDENDFFGEGGGQPSEVSGIASHAEGYAQMVAGHYNHAEGRKNTISGQYVTAAHAEGSENTINDSANYSHAEGELNIINAGCRNAHVEGAGNIADRNYQHLSGVLSKTTHNVDDFYGDHSDNNKAKPVTFAIGGGFNSVNIVDDRLNPAKKGNIFAVTEDGDTYIAGHLEVEGTSDLSGRATIGDSVANHELALEVLKHSKFDQNVTIESDGTRTITDITDYSIDKSLNVKGQSLFGDTLTIGKEGIYNDQAVNRTGTFWENLDQDLQASTFIGLNVHGEIKNERIPDNLYTSIVVQGKRVFNEFADKFWTNSSIATATATYRGCYTKADYDPDHVDPYNPEEMAEWLDENVVPFVAGKVLVFNSIEDLPNPKNYWKYSTANSRWDKVSPPAQGATIEVVYELPITGNSSIYYELNATMNAVYKVGAKYYQWVWDDETHVSGDYEEVDATPDNNDYCFVQIEEDAPILPYVLFPDDESLDDPIELEGMESNGKNIVTHRYKYVQILDPTTGEVLNQGWRFEYQLNNSGFTQAQWDAINSGITNSWMGSIENRFENLQHYVDDAISAFTGQFVTISTTQSITGHKRFENGIAFGTNNSWIYLKTDPSKGIVNGPFYLPSMAQGLAWDGTDELAALGYVKNNYVSTDSRQQHIVGKKRFGDGVAFGDNNTWITLDIPNSYNYNVTKFTLPSTGQLPVGSYNGTQELAALQYIRDNFVYTDYNGGSYQYIKGLKRFEQGIDFGTNNTYLHLRQPTSIGNTATFTLPSTSQGLAESCELAAKEYVDNNFVYTYYNSGSYQTIKGRKRFSEGIYFGYFDSQTQVDCYGSLKLTDWNANKVHFILPTSAQGLASNSNGELAAKDYVDKKLDGLTETFFVEFQTGTPKGNNDPHETVKTYLLRSYKTSSGSYVGCCQFNMYHSSHYNNSDNRIQYHITQDTKNKFSKFKLIEAQFLSDKNIAEYSGIESRGWNGSTHYTEWGNDYDDFYVKSKITGNDDVITIFLKVEFTL